MLKLVHDLEHCFEIGEYFMVSIPVIDLGDLISDTSNKRVIADQMDVACRHTGFFYVRNSGVNPLLIKRLEAVSHEFFSRSIEEKMGIEMKKSGKAWRGYFPVGGELTSGKPDIKEGLYFGEELDSRSPLVRASLPLHGSNLFPSQIPEFRNLVIEYIHQLTTLGHHLMRGLSLALGLDEFYFRDQYTKDPFVLFRIFNYPLQSGDSITREEWGVGEHTDYGLLTILHQDQSGGLEVKSGGNWIQAEPIENTFICNIGDMLDKATAGIYKSTLHRVRNKSVKSRLSFPFFFDPNYFSRVCPIFSDSSQPDSPRWDNQNLHLFSGTYGSYIESKVSKVFPDLFSTVIAPDDGSR